jgi:hypothetical protein
MKIAKSTALLHSYKLVGFNANATFNAKALLGLGENL